MVRMKNPVPMQCGKPRVTGDVQKKGVVSVNEDIGRTKDESNCELDCHESQTAAAWYVARPLWSIDVHILELGNG